MPRKPNAINIYKIADEANVSPATVSRVINRRVGVGEATRRKVSKLLQEYDFAPDYPVMNKPKIAVVTPWEELTHYVQASLKGVYSYARDNDLSVNLVIYDAKTKDSLLKTIRDQQNSAVIALLANDYRAQLDAFAKSDIPVVMLDLSEHNCPLGFIDNDSYSGSCEAAAYLLSLGHKAIGYLRYENDSLNQLQRFKGYQNTLNAAGIELKAHWCVKHTCPTSLEVRGKTGLQAMRLLLKQAPEITAVMAVDDDMALGALTAIHETGRRIPQDISIIGFDNFPETEVWFPALTTVNHPIELASRMAVQAIHASLRNIGSWVPPREILPTSLVIRNSCGPVPQT